MTIGRDTKRIGSPGQGYSDEGRGTRKHPGPHVLSSYFLSYRELPYHPLCEMLSAGRLVGKEAHEGIVTRLKRRCKIPVAATIQTHYSADRPPGWRTGGAGLERRHEILHRGTGL